MCSFESHEKEHQESCDDGNSGGGCTLPPNLTKEALVFIGGTIYVIGCSIKVLEHNVLERSHMYIFAMKKIFLKISVELPKPSSPEG